MAVLWVIVLNWLHGVSEVDSSFLQDVLLKGVDSLSPKDADEDRWISPCKFVNSVVNDSALFSVAFPHLPQLASLTAPKGGRLILDKRDARHYFPSLALGEAWQAFMTAPAIEVEGCVWIPVHQSWPQGLKGSPAFAQGVTDVVTNRAMLPSDRRCLPGIPMPYLPRFGGASWTMCGFCASSNPVLTEKGRRTGSTASRKNWRRIHVQSHEAKAATGIEMGEFLGAEVDSEHGTMGLSDRKMFSLMQAALWVGLQWKPALGCAERVLGKVRSRPPLSSGTSCHLRGLAPVGP